MLSVKGGGGVKSSRYRWVVCAASFLLLFCCIGLTANSFTVYQPYLITQKGISNTQCSMLVTLRCVASLSGLFFIQFYYQKIGIRLGTTLALLLMASCRAMFAFGGGYPSYVAATCIGGFAHSLGGMVPASLVLTRWFRERSATAISICAAGTGLASVVAPPVLTYVIERVSLKAAFLAEAAFGGCAAILILIFMRDRPAEELEHAAVPTAVRPKRDWGMLTASLLLGTMGVPGYATFTLLYRSEGFDSATVALLISLLGASLLICKCLYGMATDHMGSYPAARLFFCVLVAAQALTCLAVTKSLPVAVASMLLQGFSLPLTNVGVSVFAKDMSRPDTYAATLREYQIAGMVGAIAFSPMPGVLADWLGSYVPTYILLTVSAAASMILVCRGYRARAAEGAGR